MIQFDKINSSREKGFAMPGLPPFLPDITPGRSGISVRRDGGASMFLCAGGVGGFSPLFTVGLGRYAQDLPETFVEVRRVVKTEVRGDFGDGKRGVSWPT